jgi:predicted O-methyltransferase YrrM
MPPEGAIYRSDDPGEPGVGAPRIAIDPWEGRLLSELAIGKRVIEIGTGLGISTAALARSAFEVVTVDVDPWVAAVIAPTLPPTVTFRSTCPNPGDYPPFDLAFIDGCHSADAVTADVKAVLPLLRHQALVVFHDWPAVAEAVEALGVKAAPVTTRYGLGLAFVHKEA